MKTLMLSWYLELDGTILRHHLCRVFCPTGDGYNSVAGAKVRLAFVHFPLGGGGGGQRKDKRGDAPCPRSYLPPQPTYPNDHFFIMVTMAYDHDDDDRKLPAASVGEEDDSDVEMEGE